MLPRGNIDPERAQIIVPHGCHLLALQRDTTHVGEDRIWIITEADRSATTILLPDEY